MGEQVLEQFPAKIQAGLSLKHKITVPDYPGPDWVVKAILVGPEKLEITAQADRSSHEFSVAATTTSEWQPGHYALSIRASKDDDVFEVAAGAVEVFADLATIGGSHDPRTHAQKVLAAIEAVIEGRASKDQMGYSINGRSLQRTPLGDLINLRSQYRAEVRSQKRRGKSRMGRKIKVRFE